MLLNQACSLAQLVQSWLDCSYSYASWCFVIRSIAVYLPYMRTAHMFD
jgi:hypothetical protein